MGNSHWSQFSHEPKLFIFNPLIVVLSLLMLFAAQWSFFLVWIVGAMWVYTLVFQFFLKMPISYTGNLIRRVLTGKNKKPKNWRDSLEF